MSSIVCRIGNYEIVSDRDEEFVVRRAEDGLEWSRNGNLAEARKEAAVVTAAGDAWRQMTRGTGLMPTDFGRLIKIGGEFRRIVGYTPAAREQKVITQSRKFRVAAFTVDEVLKELRGGS